MQSAEDWMPEANSHGRKGERGMRRQESRKVMGQAAGIVAAELIGLLRDEPFRRPECGMDVQLFRRCAGGDGCYTELMVMPVTPEFFVR